MTVKEFFPNSNSKVGKTAKYCNHTFQGRSTWVQSRLVEAIVFNRDYKPYRLV